MNFFEGLGFYKKREVAEIIAEPEAIEINEEELETVSVERAVELMRIDPEVQELVLEWKMLSMDPVGDDTRLLNDIEEKISEVLARKGVKLEFREKPYGIEGDDSIPTFIDLLTKSD